MNRKLTNSEFEYIISRIISNANDVIANDDKSDFFKGKKLAYYEVLDTIKNELIARDIDLKQFGLDTKLEDLLGD